MNLISNSAKKEQLINSLLKANCQNEECDLILVSCYFTPKSAEEIIIELKSKLESLSRVLIYIDRCSAINIGKEELTKWISNIENILKIKIDFRIVKNNCLFHVKAYCIFFKNSGSLVIGSANLTGKGLTDSTGNIELLHDTQEKDKISSFVKDLFKYEYINVSELELFNDEQSFKYALIKEGYFIKRNDITLNSLLSFVYKFNDKGKKEFPNEDVSHLGLETKNGYSKNYFEEMMNKIELIFKKYNCTYDTDWGNYGIKTAFGYWIPKNIYWIPKNIINYLSSDIDDDCKREVKQLLEEYLDKAKNLMKDAWLYLLDKDWLTKDYQKYFSEKRVERELKKIINNCLKQLDKLLFRYDIIEIPLDCNNNSLIDFIYAELKESIKNKLDLKENSQKNITINLLNNEESTKRIDDLGTIKNQMNFNDQIKQEIVDYLSEKNFFDNKTQIICNSFLLAEKTKKLIFIKYLYRDIFVNLPKLNLDRCSIENLFSDQMKDTSKYLATYGYNKDNCEILEKKIKQATQQSKNIEITETKSGRRFEIKIQWYTINRKVIKVITIWQQDENSDYARFVTLRIPNLKINSL
jgi:hypothetical protein